MASLPLSLSKAIEKALKTQNLRELQQGRRTLTESYRTPKGRPPEGFMRTETERLAYLAARLPATYAVCRSVFHHFTEEDHQTITSLLDLGAGPGSILWAAREIFPRLEHITLVEQDESLGRLGASLWDEALKKKQIQSLYADLLKVMPFKAHDLVTLSYVLGELDPSSQALVLQEAWKATTHFLVLIEPGTPPGFDRLKEARRFLIDQGAFILAPCPHENPCPMAGMDWCHFSQRLERTLTHRQVKDVSQSYEDEKYSYLIAARKERPRPSSRLVRKPKKGSGHFILDLCTGTGLKRVILSKKTKKLYEKARHLKWGDGGPSLEDT